MNSISIRTAARYDHSSRITINSRVLAARQFRNDTGSPLFGEIQPPINGSVEQRDRQAEVVNNFVDDLLSNNSDANVVVLGDLNEFDFEEPLTILKGDDILVNLTETLPEAERYTFIFQGNSQALDHILVSDNLVAGAEYDIVHLNAEFAAQVSDHDPVIVSLALGDEEETTVTLVGFAQLPADTFADGPPAGEGIEANDRVGPFEGQPVQGFSGVQFANEELDEFWFLSDNGFGAQDNSADYLLRIYRLAPDFTTADDGSGEVEVLDFIQLADPNNLIPFPIVNEDTAERLLTGADFDIESFTLDNDGNIWVGDEFGPFLLKFNTDGTLTEAPIPTPNIVEFDSQTGEPLAGAEVLSPQNPFLEDPQMGNIRGSRGFEGMAISPDRSTIYPMLEGSVAGDPEDSRRIYEFDPETSEYEGLVGFFRVEDPRHAIGDFTAINDSEYLVIERDNGQGETAAFKQIFKVNLEEIDSEGFVSKELLVDLLELDDPNDLNGDGSNSFDFPFLTIEDVLVIDENTILVANDNNYPFSVGRPPAIDNNEIILLELDEPLDVDPQIFDLPGDEMPMGEFQLQILHASDQEGGLPAIGDAVGFSAVLNALEDDFPNTLKLSSGYIYIAGPFLNASDDVYGQIGIGDILINNALGFQAVAIGNHEWDLGPDLVNDLLRPNPEITGPGIGPEGYPGTAFPYLSTNMDFSGEPDLAELVVEPGQEPQPNSITDSVVIEVGGEPIGIVGATTPSLPSISRIGNITLTPADDTDIEALAAEIQETVDELTATGIDKVILLSHMQQIAIEEELAELLSDVDVIMAGGSNTLLANPDDPLRPGDEAAGPYPIEFTSASDEPIYVINTDGNYKYVGQFVADFDENGIIVNIPKADVFATDDAGVDRVYGEDVDPAEVADPLVVEVTDAIGDTVLSKDGNLFGRTSVFLNGLRENLRTEETNLGNINGDANLFVAQQYDETVAVSIKNGGSIRDPIGQAIVPPGSTTGELELLPPAENPLTDPPKREGDISQLDIENALRFNNDLTLVTVTASELKSVVEHAVSTVAPGNTPGSFAQIGGMAFSFDATRQAIAFERDADQNAIGVETEGDRVRSLALKDEEGNILDVVVRDGEVAGDPDREIRVVTSSFMAGGGDSYPFPLFGENRVDLIDEPLPPDAENVAVFADSGTEQDALAEYLAVNFPADDDPATPEFNVLDVGPELDERIQNLAARSDTVLEEMPPNVPVFGRTRVFLNGTEENLLTEETNLASLTADANLFVAQQYDEMVAVSLKNAGGITDGISSGDISQLDIEDALDFNNDLILLTVTAGELKSVVEHTVSDSIAENDLGGFPTIGGMAFSFDATQQTIVLERDAEGNVTGVETEGDRVRSLAIKDEEGNIIDVVVRDGEVVGEETREIRLVTLNFLADGGDGYPFPLFGENRVDLTEEPLPPNADNVAEFTDNGTEQDALAEYLAANFPADDDPATPEFDVPDVGPESDDRIQNLAARSDTVLEETPIEDPVFGRTSVFLNGLRENVRTEETNLGNLTGDANLFVAQQYDETVAVSIKHSGGIRDAIGQVVLDDTTGEIELLPPAGNPLVDPPKRPGDISQLDIENTLRFNNDLTLVTVTALQLKSVVEHAVSTFAPGNAPGGFAQIGGMAFSFDATRQAIAFTRDDAEVATGVETEGDRVRSLAIKDEEGNIIDVVVRDGEVVGEETREIRLVTLNFLADGGDGYPFPLFGENRVDLTEEPLPPNADNVAEFTDNGTEQDALAEYLAANFPADDDPATPEFDVPDVGPESDDRIQNLAARSDTVLEDAPPMPMPGMGTPGNDILIGKTTDDTIAGGLGDDAILGGDGDDRLSGDPGNDLLLGGPGADSLLGGMGNDTLLGIEGNDFIDGGSGDDILSGGAGQNILLGGTGSDTFVLRTGAATADRREADVLVEFEVGVDAIGLTGRITFADLVLESLGTSTLIKIDDGSDRILGFVNRVTPDELSPNSFVQIDIGQV